MALITLRQILAHAAEHGYAVPAFDVNNREQVRAIMEVTDATDIPMIAHRSSSVPQEALHIINTYGGALGLGAKR
jgi:fructose-bisphosphate aldolase, class II